ncbi:MAG: hypothetical protein M1816_000092 [Peltula sp. TS41687]|nr:MAG: hypothetical protein M1816_000092 [Peltula sp. TS41687]
MHTLVVPHSPDIVLARVLPFLQYPSLVFAGLPSLYLTFVIKIRGVPPFFPLPFNISGQVASAHFNQREQRQAQRFCRTHFILAFYELGNKIVSSRFIHLPLRSDAAPATQQDCYDVLREYADYRGPAIGRLVVGHGMQKCETDSPFCADQWPTSDELVGLDFGGCEGQGVDAKTSEQSNPLRYMTSIPAVQAPSGIVSYPISPELPMSPVEVNGEAWSTSPSSAASSSLAFSPFTNAFPSSNLTGTASSHQTSLKPSYATSTSLPPPPSPYAMSDLRPRMPPPAPVMPPPSSSPHTHVSNAMTASAMAPSTRDYYTTSTPHLSRHTLPGLLSSSPRSPISRSVGPSMLSPGQGPLPFGSSTDPPRLEQAPPLALAPVPAGPPLQPTLLLHQITTADGQAVRPDIHARIDKGFFLFDQDWTCYRRNYFSVACSFTLKPALTSVPLYLNRSDAIGGPARVGAFAMSISAVVDDAAGKPVELIQHTPKRDKGPLLKPEPIQLIPQLDGSLGLFAGAFSSGRIHHEYDRGGSHSSGGEHQTVAHFERIQFKSATANNGKRRAAQQYYHLVVDLFADVGSSLGFDGRWVKVAKRVSAPVVVRGRSPGHYQDDRRGSSSSMGPRSSGNNEYGGRGNPFSNATPAGRGLGDSSYYGAPTSSLGGNSGYQMGSLPPILGETSSGFNSHLGPRRISSACYYDQDVDMTNASSDESSCRGDYPSPPPEPEADRCWALQAVSDHALPPPDRLCGFDYSHVVLDQVSMGTPFPETCQTVDHDKKIHSSAPSTSSLPWQLGSCAVREHIKIEREGRGEHGGGDIKGFAYFNSLRI